MISLGKFARRANKLAWLYEQTSNEKYLKELELLVNSTPDSVFYGAMGFIAPRFRKILIILKEKAHSTSLKCVSLHSS